MDFLKIRKKAQERAAVREAEERKRRIAGGEEQGRKPAEKAGRAGRPAKAPGPPAPDSMPLADPVVTDADVIEGELAARLQGVPQAPDAAFTMWRPGESAPPVEPDRAAGERGQAEPEATAFRRGWTDPPTPAPAPAPAPPAPATAAPVDPLEGFFYREDEEAPVVPSIGGPAPPRAEEDPDTALREEYLTFLLGGEEYAVPIEVVREVLRSPPIAEIPRAPSHILGVVTVRGEVVAVLDPRRRLGLPAGSEEAAGTRVVIVDAGEGPCGLLVDGVRSVVRLRPGTIEPCPQGIGGASADCLAGIGRQGERLFTVLDLGALLRRAPPERTRQGERHAGP